MERIAIRPHSRLSRRSRAPWTLLLAVSTAAVLLAGPLASTASAQAFPSSGRFGLFASWSERESGTDTSSGFNDVVATLSLRPPSTSEWLFDYALDVRIATYPSTDRDTTFSLYDAYVGFTSRKGRWLARAGQMWIKDVGGLGDSDLTYFFVNLRYSPVKVLDLQGTYHRGRSIDYRSITRDQMDGRPVSPESLDGLLYETGRLRVTVRALRNLRIWASIGQDRNNDGDSYDEHRLLSGLVIRF